MEQRSNDAAVKDVQIMLSEEECAGSTGQRPNDAAVKDAHTTLSKVEYVGDTEAYHNPNDESTVTSCFGSEFEKTTTTHPNQRNSESSSNQGSLPTEVVLCRVIAENYDEV